VRLPPILVVLSLVLTGCATGSRSHGVQPQAGAAVGLAEPMALPVVMFRLLIIRDWDSPYFIIESEDVDLTLPAALEMGLPAGLWIRCLMGEPGCRFEIYWVRPLRC
jgi:hypothetical protein